MIKIGPHGSELIWHFGTQLVKNTQLSLSGQCNTVSFGDQSAKVEKSQHLILVTKTNIRCAKITVMAKWVTNILTITYSPLTIDP